MNLTNIKRAVACLLIFIGGFGLPTTLLYFSSPFGASFRDASDPLGTPISSSESLLAISIYVVMIVLGVWLAVSCRREDERD